MKALFRRTLVRRVSLGLAGAFAALYCALVAYAVGAQRVEETERKALRDIGIGLTQSLGALSEPGEVRATVSTLNDIFIGARRFADVPGTVLMQVWDREAGHMVFSSREAGVALLTGAPDRQTRQLLAGRGYSVFVGETPRWSVRLAEPDLAGDLGESWLWLRAGSDLLPYMVIAFPILLLPIWFSVSRGLRPLQQLTDQIAARSGDDLSAVGVPPTYEELSPLVSSLDHLLARLRQKVEREHGFVQDAAHELRTPMAVISAQAHVLAKASDEAQRRDAEQRLDQAISRASHLIDQLLVLASVDAEHGRQLVRVDVAQWVRQLLAQRAPGAMARGVELSLDAPDTLSCRLDLQAFQSVVDNLVDNAVRYHREGGRVLVFLSGDSAVLGLSVADDGPGIPESDKALVFERFHRGTGHDAPGSGLGLAIVRQAVSRMQGEVTLATGLDGRGCCFAVSIPVSSEPGA